MPKIEEKFELLLRLIYLYFVISIVVIQDSFGAARDPRASGLSFVVWLGLLRPP
jgi:hypothetical protein